MSSFTSIYTCKAVTPVMSWQQLPSFLQWLTLVLIPLQSQCPQSRPAHNNRVHLQHHNHDFVYTIQFTFSTYTKTISKLENKHFFLYTYIFLILSTVV